MDIQPGTVAAWRPPKSYTLHVRPLSLLSFSQFPQSVQSSPAVITGVLDHGLFHSACEGMETPLTHFFPRRRCPYLNRVKTPQGSFRVFTSPPISRLCWLPSTGCHLLRWTSQLPEPGGSHYCFHQIDFAISVCIWESRRAGEIKAPT